MISKIKEFWYVQVPRITHLGYDAVHDEFTYSLENDAHVYTCNKEEGLQLIIELDRFIDIRNQLMKEQADYINHQRSLATSPQDKINEMKSKLMAHKDA